MKLLQAAIKWVALGFFALLVSFSMTAFVALGFLLGDPGPYDGLFVGAFLILSFISFLWLFRRWAH